MLYLTRNTQRPEYGKIKYIYNNIAMSALRVFTKDY